MLASAQRGFARLFEGGPDRVDPGLFAGSTDRIALGLAVHANTVASARLAGLRDSFPTLLAQLGDDRFAALSIAWLRRRPPLRGRADSAGFVTWLEAGDAPADAVMLARSDEAWLGAYHAQDEPPVSLAALGGRDLMKIVLRPHAAARLVQAGPQAAARLVVRPAAEVRILDLDEFERALFAASCPRATCGDMIEAALGAVPHAADTAITSCLRLIGAGAFAFADGAPS